MRFVVQTILIVVAFILSACQTTAEPKLRSISEVISQNSVIELDFVTSKNGLYYLPVNFEDETGWFVVDTGATRSALFEDMTYNLNLQAHQTGEANVFGLVESGTFPVVSAIDFKLGTINLNQTSFAVLPDRDESSYPGQIQASGVLGMDFLQNYSIYIDTVKQKLFLLDSDTDDLNLRYSWTAVELYKNPIVESENKLRFFDLRVGNNVLPALFDTGSEINLINWNATIVPELRRMKRRLRQNWELQGAVGEFSPRARVGVKQLKAGRMKWGAQDFIVLDFAHLDSLGFSDKALVIGGYPLFANRNVYIDFSQNKIWVEPEIEEAN